VTDRQHEMLDRTHIIKTPFEAALLAPLRQVFRFSGTIPLLALVACMNAEKPPVLVAQGGALRVTLTQDYFWPSPVKTRGTDGEIHEIQPFPYVTALVVDSPDGRPLGPREEAAAREAVGAYCRERGERFPSGASGRLSKGAWAFPTCAH
jgi:hypothetical protein